MTLPTWLERLLPPTTLARRPKRMWALGALAQALLHLVWPVIASIVVIAVAGTAAGRARRSGSSCAAEAVRGA